MGSDQVRGLVTQERVEGQERSEQDGLESMRRSSRRRKDLFLPDAAQPEISEPSILVRLLGLKRGIRSDCSPVLVRANQKDMYYLAELRDQVDDAARGLMGSSSRDWTFCTFLLISDLPTIRYSVASHMGQRGCSGQQARILFANNLVGYAAVHPHPKAP